MSNYIVEAFKAMNLLESEDISLNQDGFDTLKGFMDEAGVDPDEETTDVFDLEAEAEEDLKDSYIGKVVLECSVCHSDIFVDKAEVSVGTDAEALACYDIECPYCMSNEGYTIIGEVAPFNQEVADSLNEPEIDESPADDEIPAVDVEGAVDKVDEEDLEESLTEGCHKEEKLDEEMKLDGVEELYDNDEIRGDEALEGVDELEGVEELHGDKHEEPINESIDSYTVTLDVASEEDTPELVIKDLKINCNMPKTIKAKVLDMSGPGGGWPVVKFVGPKEDLTTFTTEYISDDAAEFIKPLNESLNEDIEDVTVTTEDETMTMTTKEDGGVVIETSPVDEIIEEEPAEIESEEEMIVPLSDESVDEVEAAADANSVEDGEEAIEFEDAAEEEPTDDFEDFEDFDEESFNGLGESYLRECYENVVGFKTTGASVDGKKLVLEGVIKFDSGNIKETEFVFESIGNGKFEGYNTHISRGKKTYRLNTSVKNNKLVCEALNYNYRSRNELNESVRVYGTVKRK